MFRLDAILPAEADTDMLLRAAELNAVHLLEMSDRYSDAVVDLCEDRLSLEEYREVLNI